MLTMHGTELEERPSRRHNKIGIVESRNNSIRLFVQRILKDSDYYRVNFRLVSSMSQVLSRATFFANALRGSALFSSFELARVYSPSCAGLPQTKTSKEVLDAYYEQQAKRSLHRMLRSRVPKVIKAELLKPKMPIYYYVKEAKQGNWKLGFVEEAMEHKVIVTTNSQGRGHIAYEDIRMVPSTALLYEIE